MGSTKFRIQIEIIDRIKSLYSTDCYSVSEIQRITGISRPTIYRIIKGLHKIGPYIVNKEVDEKVILEYSQNGSITFTAFKIGTSRKNVREIIKINNIFPTKGRRYKYLIGSKEDGWIRLANIEYQQLLDKQGKKCAICGTPFTQSIPHADHKHGKLAIRSFLCRKCNIGLAFVEDKEFRSKAIDYLKRYGDYED